MSDLRMIIAVLGARGGQAIGIKEAVAMDLEKYGNVQVLQVDVLEPEQLTMAGAAPSRPAKATARQTPEVPPAGGQASAAPRGQKQKPVDSLRCCMTCANYRNVPGRGADGQLYWGMCAHTGKPVYKLGGWCRAWAQKR